MKKNSILIVISCLIGLMAASIYASRITRLRDEITSFSEKVPVLVVIRDISLGESLRTEDLSELKLPKAQLSRRTISPSDLELILGRRVIHPVPAGDPILWTDFPEGPRVRKSSEIIPKGLRAIAVNADEIHTLMHFISPGDKVDIVSSDFDTSKGRLFTKLIAENILILSVGRRLDAVANIPGDESDIHSITLLVDPINALTILRASQTGEIHFLARGSNPFIELCTPIEHTLPTENHQDRKL